MTEYRTLRYRTDGRIARITLSRPGRYNAIGDGMPEEIAAAVERANRDDAVHCIVLDGDGPGFSGGYDLKDFAERPGTNAGVQKMPWDPSIDYQMMMRNTEHFLSLWRSAKPTIAKVHGTAVAGGSDIALSCDLVVMAENARIGYPPARVWGCPTTAMWVYRLGPERAKRMLLTGDVVDGKEARALGLVLDAVPEDELEDRVLALARRIASVPKNQLFFQKMVVNQAIDAMGFPNTTRFATIFDGMARHTPEGMAFKKMAEEEGFQAAVKKRDGGEDL